MGQQHRLTPEQSTLEACPIADYPAADYTAQCQTRSDGPKLGQSYGTFVGLLRVAGQRTSATCREAGNDASFACCEDSFGASQKENKHDPG